MPTMDSGRRRRPTRLRGYDYRTPALYHVVTTTNGHVCYFGDVRENIMLPNAAGEMIGDIWQDIPRQFPTVSLDAWIVMPNHVHGIIFIEPQSDNALTVSLGDVMKWLKAITATRYSRGVHDHGWPPYDGKLWHRNYYDHIIRDDQDLDRVRDYIERNPANWKEDRFRPLPDS